MQRSNPVNKYNLYPWGEEKTTTGQNVEKFATYYRDGTGLDYADQRYYSSIMGRFLTPDPYKAQPSGAASPADPQSWNRYAYALNDPINYYDPTGELQVCPEGTHLEYAGNFPHCFMDDRQNDKRKVQKGEGTGGKGGVPGGGAGRSDPVASAVSKVLANNTNCYKDITDRFGTAPGHGSIEDMMSKTGQVALWDTGVPSIASMMLSDVVSNTAERNQTLASYVGDNAAVVPYLQIGPNYKLSDNIILSSTYSTNSPTQQALLLTHEMLHIYTNRDDNDLAAALGLTLNGEDPSAAIRDYLGSDCKKKVF